MDAECDVSGVKKVYRPAAIFVDRILSGCASRGLQYVPGITEWICYRKPRGVQRSIAMELKDL
jgi:hypothetical protein